MLDPTALHCLCAKVPLAALTGYPSLAAFQTFCGAGTFCRLCLPYLETLAPPSGISR